ncbi:hypothetical protein DVH24_036560 [Malus domestica]|uniref:Uncharacterized protein n=1 Tax=Malus domestica TaxID=3750 RepID=A0A498IGN1_MALDO|nr:hypothetical protein DVH24_036560 [Malus domestica]
MKTRRGDFPRFPGRNLFRRPLWLLRGFPAKPQRVKRRARYHSLRLFENYDFRLESLNFVEY